MDNKSKQEEQLDRYISGLMEANELADFLKEAEQNPDLMKEIKLRQLMAEGIATYAQRDWKKRLMAIQEEVKNEDSHPKKVSSNKKYIRLFAIAASILLLITAAAVIYQMYSTPKDLFATYYQAYPPLFSERNNTTGQLLQSANEHYLQQSYPEALGLFQQELQQTPNNAKLLLAIGICQIETKQPAAAVQSFQNIIDLNDPYLSDQARWYAALALIQQDQLSIATSYLQILAEDPNADHHQDAQKLLKDLQ